MLVSPELEVWLLADPDMASSWRGLARALDLASAIAVLEVTHRRRLASDKDKLTEVLRRWRAGPVPYTVDTLLRVLDIMGKKSMYEWIELMTKERLVLNMNTTAPGSSPLWPLLRPEPSLTSRSLSPPGRNSYYSPLHNNSRSLQNSPIPPHNHSGSLQTSPIPPHNHSGSLQNSSIPPHNHSGSLQNSPIPPHNYSRSLRNSNIAPHNFYRSLHNSPAASINYSRSLQNSPIPPHNYSVSLQNSNITPHYNSRSSLNSPLPAHNYSKSLQNSPRTEARARPGSVYSILYRPQSNVSSPSQLHTNLKREQDGRGREPRDIERETRRHSSYFVTNLDTKVDSGTRIEGSRPYSSAALNEFDDAFAEYKHVTWATKRREKKKSSDIEKYFENLATLLIKEGEEK